LRTIRMMAREQPNCRGSGSSRMPAGCKGRVNHDAERGVGAVVQ
jgi:hypothetical protein